MFDTFFGSRDINASNAHAYLKRRAGDAVAAYNMAKANGTPFTNAVEWAKHLARFW